MPKRKKPQKQSPSAPGTEKEVQEAVQQGQPSAAEDTNNEAVDMAVPSPTLTPLPSLSRILSVLMLILGICAVGALFYKVMAGFFVPLFLAALLVVLFRPVYIHILKRCKHRRQLAAMATTLLIMTVVLFPIFLLISIAASQFTAMVSHVDFNDLSAALDRGREQVGISLPYPEQFRRLDSLSDRLDEPESPELDRRSFISSEPTLAKKMVLKNINEALTLVKYLQAKVDGPATADEAALIAEEKLVNFRNAVQNHETDSNQSDADELIGKLSADELIGLIAD